MKERKDIASHKHVFSRWGRVLPVSISVGKLTFYKDGRLAVAGRRSTKLVTPIQFTLLCILHKDAGSIVSWTELLTGMYGNDTDHYKNRLKAVVFKLRRLLNHDPTVRIDTINGSGMKLVLNGGKLCIPDQEGSALQFNDIFLYAQQLIKADGTAFALTYHQFNILTVFFRHPEKLISWDALQQALAETGTWVELDVFRVQLCRIRKFLAKTDIAILTRDGEYILTIQNEGSKQLTRRHISKTIRHNSLRVRN